MFRGLTFVPSGGLANRMVAIASAVNLCRQTNTPLKIIWFEDWGLKARFDDIFESISGEAIILQEAHFIDKLTTDRARKHNLFIPSIYQKLFFSNTIEEKCVTNLNNTDFDFEKWVLTGQYNWMSSYSKFGSFTDYDNLIRSLFMPVPTVMDIVNKYTCHFSEYTIGVHVRRTDNIYSIKHSPISKFVKTIENEISVHSNAAFFLATDDDSVKDDLLNRFGTRIITPESTADRSSVSGIRNGVAEMWTLAATTKIIGSYGSTYSTMASTIGGIDLNIMN